LSATSSIFDKTFGNGTIADIVRQGNFGVNLARIYLAMVGKVFDQGDALFVEFNLWHSFM
jgi:hypothetical protein